MIAIISDVHGNLPALTSVLAEIDRMGVGRIACLGDVAGYYCSVNECVEALRARDIVNLMGNHDYYLTSGTGSPRSTSANRCLDYQRRTITEDNLRWLAASPPRAIADGVSIVHAGWNDPIDEYLYDVPPEYFHAFEGTSLPRVTPTSRASGSSTGRSTATPARSGSPAMAIHAPRFPCGPMELRRSVASRTTSTRPVAGWSAPASRRTFTRTCTVEPGLARDAK